MGHKKKKTMSKIVTPYTIFFSIMEGNFIFFYKREEHFFIINITLVRIEIDSDLLSKVSDFEFILDMDLSPSK